MPVTRSVFFSLSCALLGAGVVLSCGSDSGTEKSGNAGGAGQSNAGAVGTLNGGAPNGGTAGMPNAGSAVGGAPEPPSGGVSGAADSGPTEGGGAGEANALNECGGLAVLVGSKGDACGACGHLVCAADKESLLCDAGVPNWIGTTGVVVPELNDPRWAPAPKTAFSTDLTEQAGFYRIMLDPNAAELLVSFQVPTDPGVPSNADTIYFGFTSDGTGGSAAKAVTLQMNGVGDTDPMPVNVIQQRSYDVAAMPQWTAILGAPVWLKDAAAWRNNVAGDAAWGINFKVQLGAAGLGGVTAFKVIFALHKQNETTPANSVDMSTPDPGANALLPTTLLIADPAKWAIAAESNATCASGLTIIPEY
jgi:hypothetical protein